MPTIHVFFRDRPVWGWRRCLRHRGWRNRWWALLEELAARLGGPGRCCHVAIGDGYVVLEPHIGGDRLVGHSRYVAEGRYDRRWIVPAPGWPTLHTLPRRSAWPAIIRWMTRGRTKSADCVVQAIVALRSAGVDLPIRIWHPKQLQLHLGTHHAPRRDAARHEAADRDPRRGNRAGNGAGAPAAQ